MDFERNQMKITKLTILYEDHENRRFIQTELVTKDGETPQNACKRFVDDGYIIKGDDDDHLKYYPGTAIMHITWEK